MGEITLTREFYATGAHQMGMTMFNYKHIYMHYTLLFLGYVHPSPLRPLLIMLVL
jgi:hypothetical protein